MTIKDLESVQTALWDARPKWYNIGLKLGVTAGDLDVIKRRNLNNDDECLTDLLAQWLRQANPPPTWNSIIDALRSPTVNLTPLADQVESSSSKSSLDTASSTATVKMKKNDCGEVLQFESNEHVASNQVPEKRAVNKDSLTFRHIREFQGLDDKQKEELEQRLTMESEDIQLRFHILCNKFFNTLDALQLDVKKLVRHLKGLKALKCVNSPKSAAVIQSYEYVLENIDNVESVKDVIEENSTFFDYRPVEYMIEIVGMEKDKRQLETYKEDFEHYIKRRVFECPTKIGPTHAPNNKELHVKVEFDYSKLVKLKQFQCRLSLILEVSVHVLRISSIKEGCIQLTFLIPSFVQEAIFPLSAEQEVTLKELGIIQLSCGDYHFPAQVYSHTQLY